MSTDLIIFLASIFQQEHIANKRRRTAETAAPTTATTATTATTPTTPTAETTPTAATTPSSSQSSLSSSSPVASQSFTQNANTINVTVYNYDNQQDCQETE